jgi:hypothetical protein
MEGYLKAPMHPDYEPIGRMLENCLGVKELIVLHANYWDFYDWMEDEGYDMAEWFKQLDQLCPANIAVGGFLMGRLWNLECDRYREGLSCPPSSPPLGYEE